MPRLDASDRPQRHLPASDGRFRALLEAAPDAIVIADADGRIILVNAQTERLFGYPRQRLIGEKVEVLVPERYRGHHVGHRSAYGNEPRIRPMGADLDLFGLRADGTEVPVEISLSPVSDADGRLVIAAIRDVTARREAEQRIQDLNERLLRDNTQLSAVNSELESFSYSVSHDLRAPLRAIDGFSQALLEDCAARLDTEDLLYLKRIRQAAQRMGLLIDDLLQLSRVTRADITLEPVDLGILVRDILDDMCTTEPTRFVDIQIPQHEIPARGDPRLLRIALENLISNAWKFTSGRRSSRIAFGVRGQDGETVYFLQDNGVGFDMAYANQLFRAFQRLHDAREFPGVGIGLATVQRIIRKHGGRIWAQAEPDKGATFYFTLGPE